MQFANVRTHFTLANVNAALLHVLALVAVGVLTKTYRTAPKALVATVLGVSDIDAFLNSKGWKVADSAVHLPEEQTQLKFKPATDNIRFDRA